MVCVPLPTHVRRLSPVSCLSIASGRLRNKWIKRKYLVKLYSIQRKVECGGAHLDEMQMIPNLSCMQCSMLFIFYTFGIQPGPVCCITYYGTSILHTNYASIHV